MGVSLDELGISLINIRSTGFANVAALFHDRRVRKRCSIITDLDAAFIDTSPDPTDEAAVARAEKALGSQKAGTARKTALKEFCQDNPWVKPFFAPHTFEVDFTEAGNAAKIAEVLKDVYKDAATIARAKAELDSSDIAIFGERVLTMATNAGKGWFAILIGKVVDHHTIIPDYILKAIFFAHGTVTRPIIYNILSYRLSKTRRPRLAFLSRKLDHFREKLEGYRQGTLGFADIRQAMLEALPDDEINNILAGL